MTQVAFHTNKGLYIYGVSEFGEIFHEDPSDANRFLKDKKITSVNIYSDDDLFVTYEWKLGARFKNEDGSTKTSKIVKIQTMNTNAKEQREIIKD